ncbi:MAG: hypothetical protein J0I84_07415 [Terrimonas sp.]|nr:hypothetical protein [Terrimonas sp.]OJY93586.1 MAG: hypothetical protein BGP13_04125 [Sphingobacteriales bacterium 40-81]
MRYLSFLILSIIFFSCSKKESTAPKEGINRVADHYSRGKLSWEQTVDGVKTTGTDDNSSFDVVYKDKKAIITVNTTAPVANKSYQFPLVSPETSSNGYIFQLVENTDIVQGNSVLRVTITTSKSAQIDFNKTDKSSGKTIKEVYTLTGIPKND